MLPRRFRGSALCRISQAASAETLAHACCECSVSGRAARASCALPGHGSGDPPDGGSGSDGLGNLGHLVHHLEQVRELAGRGAGYAQVRERVLALLTGRYEQADPKTRLVRLPVPAGLADATEQLRQVQRQKTAAFEAGDFDSAAALRARENQPTALCAWLTSHGWQLEPGPLCPAHSNSTKD